MNTEKRADFVRINAVQTIKETLNTREVFEYYGFIPDRRGCVNCFKHSEKTPSLKIYDGKEGYYCFGCGASGDVITFVKEYFNLSFQEALRKLDNDFNLNIYGDHTFEELRQSHYKEKMLKAKKEREEREKQKENNDYWEAFDEYKRLDDNFNKYKPKSQQEELHPLFVEALQKLEHQKFVLECLEQKRCRNV